jgi:NAD-dependent dihydropyrimidine dehydrogenase PreA subunit
MAMRNIIKIDEERCNGCGKCAKACAEGAIKIIHGKATLVSEVYCDGLGACIGTCPVNAIKIVQQEAAEFDEEATKKHLEEIKAKPAPSSGDFMCPGMMAKNLKPKESKAGEMIDGSSQLGQWPVQLKLVSANAPYFKNADLMLVADCVAFAMGDFHQKLLKGKAIAIACPKLDDTGSYVAKIADIIKSNNLKSITAVRMEVPCCMGIVIMAQKAIGIAGTDLPLKEMTISLDGRIIEE